MDIRETAHLYADSGILKSVKNNCNNFSVVVGDGSRIHVTHVGNIPLSPHPFRTLLHKNVIIILQIIKNLIFVRKFSRDNIFY